MTRTHCSAVRSPLPDCAWTSQLHGHVPSPGKGEGKLEGKELENAVNQNADAQAYKEDPSTKVVAQVVDQEPAAELANGDADLSTTGLA